MGILNAYQYVFVFHLLYNDIDALNKLLTSISGLKKAKGILFKDTLLESAFHDGKMRAKYKCVCYSNKNSLESKLLHRSIRHEKIVYRIYW